MCHFLDSLDVLFGLLHDESGEDLFLDAVSNQYVVHPVGASVVEFSAESFQKVVLLKDDVSVID